MSTKKNSSLLVILVSASQLIAMLVIIGVMYQYGRNELIEQTKARIQAENAHLLEHCQRQLAAGSEIQFANEAECRKWASQRLDQIHLPQNRFLVLANARDYKVGDDNPQVKGFVGDDLVQTSSGGQMPLRRILRQNAVKPNGELAHGDQTYLFTSMWIPEINSHLMIWEDRSAVMANVGLMVEPVKKTAFALFLLVGLIGICVSVLVLQRYDTHLTEVNQNLEDVVVARTQDLLTTQKAVIYGLAKLAESRDNDTGDHLARIQRYVTVLARSLMKYHREIDEEYIQNLSLASSLHDIGKVGVPDAILLKQGRLTPAERGIMELHTLIGGDCLSSIQAQLGENDFLEMAREIAYFHHERWDGTGYPKKRREEEIPLCARIVSVADVYDALRTKRPYKQPLPHEKSREIILSGIGTQFDPEVVGAFLENESEFERISEECSRMTEEQVTPQIKLLSEMLTSE